jgi:glycosyltransferase involved in cell wall biosynthesis
LAAALRLTYAVAVRVAWFSPVPPVQSGISAYTAEIIPRLARHHAIDLVLDESTWRTWARVRNIEAGLGSTEGGRMRDSDPTAFEAVHPLGVSVPAYRAHDFLFLHDRAPYDVIVYQLGNATCHDYMWPYLLRFAGLVVFHDGHVHHARAKWLLSQGRRDDYRVEFTFAHPKAPRDAAEYAVSGMTGASYYFYPWLRPVVARARALAAHTSALCGTIGALAGDRVASVIRMGVDDLVPPSATPAAGAGGAVTPSGEHAPVTMAAFGLITEEKRIAPLLRAFAAVRDSCAGARLRLVGARAPHFDVDGLVAELGVADAITVTGYVSDAELASHLSEADVCFCLRWPSTGETSASWLRCLAASRATVITDLLHTVHVPCLDPRSWTAADGLAVGADTGGRLVRRSPVCVAIDILDEEHSLRLALPRLCTDADLRGRLGVSARAWWAAHHTLDLMEADYLVALDAAASAPAPGVPDDFPAHLLADGTAHARRLVDDIGATVDLW